MKVSSSIIALAVIFSSQVFAYEVRDYAAESASAREGMPDLIKIVSPIGIASMFSSQLFSVEHLPNWMLKDPNDCGAVPEDVCTKYNQAKAKTKDLAEDVRDDAWYEKHSRYIRWTVIRTRLEGMPEECRYFYCDMQGGWVTKREATNFWIITLPRNKGAPEDCKFKYCQQVYTESDTRPAINEDYRGTGFDR
jgi:hypothetical protein